VDFCGLCAWRTSPPQRIFWSLLFFLAVIPTPACLLFVMLAFFSDCVFYSAMLTFVCSVFKVSEMPISSSSFYLFFCFWSVYPSLFFFFFCFCVMTYLLSHSCFYVFYSFTSWWLHLFPCTQFSSFWVNSHILMLCYSSQDYWFLRFHNAELVVDSVFSLFFSLVLFVKLF